MLKAHGADPTRRRDDATEEDRSLDAIIGNHRAELMDILGAPSLEELDRIFNIKPGPALRTTALRTVRCPPVNAMLPTSSTPAGSCIVSAACSCWRSGRNGCDPAW